MARMRYDKYVVKTLFLVRHGNTKGASSMFCGTTDVALSAEGTRQSQHCADYLLQHGVNLVITTGLKRSDYIGELLAAHGITHIVEPDLREVDFGDWERKTWQDIRAHDPAGAKAWLEHPETMRFPSGECMRAFRARLETAWQRLTGRPEKVIALISHSNASAYLLQHALKRSDLQYLRPAQILRLTM